MSALPKRIIKASQSTAVPWKWTAELAESANGRNALGGYPGRASEHRRSTRVVTRADQRAQSELASRTEPGSRHGSGCGLSHGEGREMTPKSRRGHDPLGLSELSPEHQPANCV